MKEKRTDFVRWKLILIALCVAVNVGGSYLASRCNIVLHMDTFGTIFAGALGGMGPGVIVGVLSNLLNTAFDSTMICYAVVSAVLGGLSAIFSEKGYYKTVIGWLKSSFSFVLIAGISGVAITWFLCNQSIGGKSIVIGTYLVSQGITPYFAQLIADFLVEGLDKCLMTGGVCIVFKCLPKEVLSRFSLGKVYTQEQTEPIPMRTYKKSISKRLTRIMMASVLFASIFTTSICLTYYREQVKDDSEDYGHVVSKQAAGYIDGDQIETFLREGDSNITYKETEENLKILLENSDQIAYLFVYQMQEDGTHVVFDLDTPDLQGEEPGTVLVGEQGISSNFTDYLHGEEIPDEYTSGEFGRMLTVYSSITDSSGDVVAYAGVDINMDVYYRNYLIFMIQVISITLAMMMLMLTFVIWYVKRYVSTPIQTIVHQTEQLKEISPENWLDSEVWKHAITLHTNDELEQLNHTVNELEEQASTSIRRVIETEQELLQTKKLEEINQKLEESVERAEAATQAKTMFLSNMSHDMRTPMNAIIGLSNLAMDLDTVEELKDYMTQINLSGKQLLALINDTLDVSRIENGKLTMNREYIMSSQMLQEGVASTKVIAEHKGVHFRVELSEFQDRLLYVDAVKITKIFTNLLTNAVKFTPQGGEVVFYLHRLGEENHIGQYCMGVRDTGIGMSQEFLEHIFEPFSQESTGLHTNASGTGLGMTIVKEFTDFLGAKIEIQSELGKGTDVKVWIGFEQAQNVPEEYRNRFTETTAKGKRILVAEDHPLNAQIMKKLLEKKGYIVEQACNGKECVSKFIESKVGYYGLILMDIRMPEMNGLEAAKVIRHCEREDAQQIPILAMTANAFEQDVKESIEAGMDAHLSKPVEPEKLYIAIERYLKKE